MEPKAKKLTTLGTVSSHVVVPCVLGALCRSDLINPVMRVTPPRGFHMKKTHRTEAGPGQADRTIRLCRVFHLTRERDQEN